MRKVAVVRKPDSYARRVMVYDTGSEVYVFPFDTMDDGAAMSDMWCESEAQADKLCEDSFGIGPDDWEYIDDPLPECQVDWIAPVRIKGRDSGTPKWGIFERLVDGQWVIFGAESKAGH